MKRGGYNSRVQVLLELLHAESDSSGRQATPTKPIDTMKPKTILQAAADYWPEDEAYGTAQAAINRLADYPEESEAAYRQEALNKDVAHMIRCFYRESDGAELAGRYLRELAGLNTTGMHPTCNCNP